jgi:hypothetical protein
MTFFFFSSSSSTTTFLILHLCTYCCIDIGIPRRQGRNGAQTDPHLRLPSNRGTVILSNILPTFLQTGRRRFRRYRLLPGIIHSSGCLDCRNKSCISPCPAPFSSRQKTHQPPLIRSRATAHRDITHQRSVRHAFRTRVTVGVWRSSSEPGAWWWWWQARVCGFQTCAGCFAGGIPGGQA